MFKDILLGQYYPVDSPLHNINAALKMVFIVVYMVMLFSMANPLSYVVFCLLTFTLALIGKIPLRVAARNLLPMKWILVFTVLVNLFAVKGDAVFSLTILKLSLTISSQGLYTALIVLVRLVLLVFAASLLTLTTSPLDMTYGIETLMKPLEKIKFPSHELAMMMSIAIRFIPVLAEQADKIMKAQASRGADFETGGLFKKAKAMLPIIIPLFVSAFKRAEELADAMESRCYNGGQRTRLRSEKLALTDIKAICFFAVGSALIIFIEFFRF